MKDFAGRTAVITGGGSGMGRELARQLVAEGCHVAICDVSAPAMAETRRLCEVERLPQGLRVTTHTADVSDEAQLIRFRDEVAEQHDTDNIHLLFNNAGIGGGGSLFANTREQWDKTFNICWGGVYLGTRTFLPMLLKADAGGPHRQHLERQRVLGDARADRIAYRLQRREIRGEGLHRSPDRRSPSQCAAHQMLGGDARPYRHLDCDQFAQGSEPQ
jgi:NAD(P)-dependent dehydrogenase (short-subunit alcohol dehydrogenase family)